MSRTPHIPSVSPNTLNVFIDRLDYMEIYVLKPYLEFVAPTRSWQDRPVQGFTCQAFYSQLSLISHWHRVTMTPLR
jgi:hypothetical protein